MGVVVLLGRGRLRLLRLLWWLLELLLLLSLPQRQRCWRLFLLGRLGWFLPGLAALLVLPAIAVATLAALIPHE